MQRGEFYLVKWAGYSVPTWEPREGLEHLTLFQQFERERLGLKDDAKLPEWRGFFVFFFFSFSSIYFDLKN